MRVHRHGDETIVAEAWSPPQFPAHMAAGCPCPSDFLVLMARSNPDHLLRCDSEERSVLSLALESGHRVGKRGYSDKDCIRRLVKVDSRMLGLQDPKTRLYPFMTAACCEGRIVDMDILDCSSVDGSLSGEAWERDIRAEAPLKCLNTIYFLLRADPSKAQGHQEGASPVYKEVLRKKRRTGL